MEVLKHPEIFDSITSDSCPSIVEWDFEIDKQEFLLGEVEDQAAALMIFYPDSPGWYCHVQVIPEYRKYAAEFGHKSLDWFWKNHEVNDLYAEIPSKYPKVVRFAEKNGFKPDITLEDIYIKNGLTYNKTRYKLERERWALQTE